MRLKRPKLKKTFPNRLKPPEREFGKILLIPKKKFSWVKKIQKGKISKNSKGQKYRKIPPILTPKNTDFAPIIFQSGYILALDGRFGV